MVAREAIIVVLDQHMEDACRLGVERRRMVQAPRVSLTELGRTDELLDAHLGALRLARGGGPGKLPRSNPLDPGRTFIQCVLDPIASEDLILRHGDDVERVSTVLDEVLDALAWLEQASVQALAQGYLRRQSKLLRRAGLSVLAAHRDLTQDALDEAVFDSEASVREKAFVAVGELGAVSLREVCTAAARDANRALAFAAQRAAMLTSGQRGAGGAFAGLGSDPVLAESANLDVILRWESLEQARGMLTSFADREDLKRELVAGVGIVGDAQYIPWLIQKMSDPALSRLAGESFSMITGLDLAYLDLDRKPPENFEGGPNDDPADENVEMDPDDGLPWPDPEKISAWWKANGSRFPAGKRFFMGQPPSMAHCLHILKTGYQRQRIAAAIWRCILKPGTPLFPTDAPSWRQRRWLSAMRE